MNSCKSLTQPLSSQPRSPRFRLGTVLLCGLLFTISTVIGLWFAGYPPIQKLFQQLELMQQQPPLGLQVPMESAHYLWLYPLGLFGVAWLITKISPRPRPWSRSLVALLLLLLTGIYITWRSLATLNLSTPLNGSFSLLLFGLELLMLVSTTIQLLLMFRVRDRRQEADLAAVAVMSGAYQPSVDVLIPSYDEPEFILRRTIIGCQAMDYANKRIYLLDDTRRPEIAQLAQELGCEYRTRADNRHAKAGNLNQAIAHTQGELIVVFDADFVPTRNFLTRTVGFFQNPSTGLVQTPQSFYNPDPIARNLGLENVLTPEEEVFYRQIQPMRDGAGSVICSGTSFVVRRSALETLGGFVTDSLSEDYFTGIRLAAYGYQLIYLDEKLSAGLAAENMAAHAIQRLRWARGTLQAFFISSNPLTIPGLSLWQRMAHLEGLLHWFTSIAKIGFLIMPLAYSFLGVIPVRTTAAELMVFFLPYYLVNLTVFRWLNDRSRSAFLSDIYSLVLVFPLAWTVIQVMLNPFSRGFKVTPKGTVSDRYSYNWNLAIPLILLFGATLVSLGGNLGLSWNHGAWQTIMMAPTDSQIKGLGLGWVWSGYNLVMLGIALLILIDVPKRDRFDWFDLRRTVTIADLAPVDTAGDRFPDRLPDLYGVTVMLSEGGAEVALTTALPSPWRERMRWHQPTAIQIRILEADLTLSGQITEITQHQGFTSLRLQFQSHPDSNPAQALQQQRGLIEMLYCRPGQWKRWRSPGEWRSIGLLLRTILQPRVLRDRRDIRPTSVEKG